MSNVLIRIAIAALLLAGNPIECLAAAKVIAAMMSSDQPRYREAHQAFVKSMAARGYASANTEFILQAPNPDPLSWSNTIRKFNAYHPDLIVAYGAPAAQAARKESSGIPVVSVDVYDSGQLTRGITGVSSRVPLITLLRTLRDIHPYRRLGVIYSAREAGSKKQFDDVRKFAAALGMTVSGGNAASPAALDSLLDSLLDRVDALFVTESAIAGNRFDRIIARATARKIPVLSTMPDAAVQGAMISLEINPQEQGHLAAEIAVRILEGANPENLSLLAPRRVDLVLNLRAARSMGISMPFPLLSYATRIIK